MPHYKITQSFSANPKYINALSNYYKLQYEYISPINKISLTSRFKTYCNMFNLGNSAWEKILFMPLETINDARSNMFFNRAEVLEQTYQELKVNAFMYADQENHTYDALNNVLASIGSSEEMSNSSLERPQISKYTISKLPDIGNIKLIEPNPSVYLICHALPDSSEIENKVKSALGWLNDVNDAILQLTGTDLINKVIEPLDGKWNVLLLYKILHEEIGKSLKEISENIRKTSSSIADNYESDTPTWSGDAAANFKSFAIRMADELEWEKSCHGLLVKCFETAHEKLLDLVSETTKDIKRRLQETLMIEGVSITLSAFLGAISAGTLTAPVGAGLTAGNAYRAVDKTTELVNKTIEKFEAILELTRRIAEVLSSIKDIMDAQRIKTLATATLKNTSQKNVESAKKALKAIIEDKELVEDLVEFSKFEHVVNSPRNGHHSGLGNNPWKDRYEEIKE